MTKILPPVNMTQPNSSRRGGRALIAAGLLAALAAGGSMAFKAAWSKAGGGGVPVAAEIEKNAANHAANNASAGDSKAVEAGSKAPVRRATPEQVETIIASAMAYVQQGEKDKAETVLAEAVRQYVDEQALRTAYGDVLVDLRRVPQAYEQYVAALSIGPRTAKIEFTAGTLANMAGKPERAMEHYQAAQTQDKANADYPLYLGQIQLKLGQTDAAKASLMRSANLDPERAATWGTLAEVAMRENNTGIALTHIAKARKLEPSGVMWRLIEARAHTRSGQPAKGLELLVGLPDHERFLPPVLKQIGECYGLLGRPAEAATVYSKASDAQPKDAAVSLEAARWFQRAGQTGPALVYARRAADLGDADAARLLAEWGAK